MSQKQAGNSPMHRVRGMLKNTAGIASFTALCVAAVCYISAICSYDVAVRVNVNGAPVGLVESQDDIAGIKTELLSAIDEATDGQYILAMDVTYDFIHTHDTDRLSGDEYAEILWSYVADDFCRAHMLYIDGRQAAANTDGEGLESLIDGIEAQMFKSGNSNFEEVRIANEVLVKEQLCLKSMVKSLDEINELINPLAKSEALEQATEPSEEFDSIVRISAISAAAPALASDDVDLDVDYGLTRGAMFRDFVLDYNFVNTVTVNETIYFETQYIDDYDNFIGNEKIACHGANGEKTVTYEIFYGAAGNIVERRSLNESIITPAVDKIVMVGVAEIPDAVPTGTFIWPCETPKGVSSYYGWRDLYGRPDFHLGIDIPDERGSAIWAADGGTVTWTGTTPSYGKSVRIAHSNGYSTLYAHLDDILVEEGDAVYKKQNIGTMGKTGVAYGTHLHFEVRINDVTVDPMNYLPK